MSQEPNEPGWFDKPSSKRLMWIILWGSCALSIFGQFFMHPHPHFEVDGIFGFYALLGFISCTLMIIGAKLLGFWLKKPEDYYDKKEDRP